MKAGKNFIDDNFLLGCDKAVELYERFAREKPIIDYHCHLPIRAIAEDRRFRNLFEIWLEGDHYKWRAMRANGAPERVCTGDADPYDKFLAWAAAVPYTLRNPLYHWTHLELLRYFGIAEPLNEKTAPAIWERAGEMLANDDLSARGILARFKVEALCTTDDPTDDLSHHRRIKESGLATGVFPTFRPDQALAIGDPAAWNRWVDRLAQAADLEIDSLSALLTALHKRHDFFHEAGCRLSDHGLEKCFDSYATERKAAAVFDKTRAGKAATPDERDGFGGFLMLFFGRLDAEKGWVKQLHLGAMRDNNRRMRELLGPDTGFDSIGDFAQGRALSRFLDLLEQERALPKTVLYNLNPADFYLMGTMIGNFQDGSAPGKMQLGSGWWFLDQKDGMERQLNTLSNLGLLWRFVGMLTDSRSFMSYPRHEYFRRVLCNLIGKDVEAGEIPDDDSLLGPMIEAVCYGNAREYFGLGVSP